MRTGPRRNVQQIQSTGSSFAAILGDGSVVTWGHLLQVPVVSVVVPFFGLTSFILRILKGNPQKGTTMETKGSFRVRHCTQRFQEGSTCPRLHLPNAFSTITISVHLESLYISEED